MTSKDDIIKFILSHASEDVLNEAQRTMLSEAELSHDGTIPHQSILHTYSIRGELLDYQYGFDRLIPELEAFMGDEVRLIVFENKGYFFLVFCDTNMTRLLGIVALPPKHLRNTKQREIPPWLYTVK